MTITLTKPVRVGGVELAAATTQTFAADVEADLVTRGFATPAGLKPGVLPVCANHLAEHEAIGFPLEFPNFRPTLLASLVAGATATRVGLTVPLKSNRLGARMTRAPRLVAGLVDLLLGECASLILGFFFC